MSDIISRQAAIDAFQNLDVELRPSAISAILNMLNDLPSAQPEPKTAYWRTHIFDGIMGGRPRAYMCNYCNFISFARTNYCPNCGARMEARNETD